MNNICLVDNNISTRHNVYGRKILIMPRKKDSTLQGIRIPIRTLDNGIRVITCESCNKDIQSVGSIDNFYSSFDMFICEDCNIGYKASILTGMNSDVYISVEPTNIKDIKTILANRERLEKLKNNTKI